MAKYPDTATVKKTKKFYKTTLTSDIIFTKDDVSTSDEQVENLSREFNIHYRACIGSLIYLLSTVVNLSFAVHKLAIFSSNTGRVNFEGLLHLLRYIWVNKNLGLKYHAEMKDAPLSNLLRQSSINTNNQLVVFSYSIRKECQYTSRSTGIYIIFHQGGTIDHGKYVPGPVAQSSAESGYNIECNTGMALSHSRMLIYEFLKKDLPRGCDKPRI